MAAWPCEIARTDRPILEQLLDQLQTRPVVVDHGDARA
jgi:hypothetical protein